MSHGLTINADGTATMAFRGPREAIWHRLGVQVGDDMTPDQMRIAASADFFVDKTPEFIRVEDAYVATEKHSLIRTDTSAILSTGLGPDWKPVQNTEAFDFFDEFVRAGDMVMDTAGVIDGGRIVWALADVKREFTLSNGDRVVGYLLFSNPHIYGKTLEVKFVMQRVVCNNTLSIALNEKGQPAVKLNHRREFDAEQVKIALGLSVDRLAQFQEAAEKLIRVKYTKPQVVDFFKAVYGKSKDDGLTRTGENAMLRLESLPGDNIAPGSWWNAFNEVTYNLDHISGRTDESRMNSGVWGSGAQLKLRAMQVALEMAA